MHRFAAAFLALAVTQQEPSPAPAGAAPAEKGAPADPAPAAPLSVAPPAAEPPRAPAPPPPAAPEPPSAVPPPPAPSPSPRVASPPTPAPAPARPAPPPRAASPAAPSAPSPLPARPAPVAPAPPEPARTLPPEAPLSPAEQERDAYLRAALAFADALLRADAAGLAAASTARFSFDGDVVQGRDDQARRWREIFSAREAAPGVLRDLVVMSAAAATAQLGPPPARLASLLRPGTWIGVADVSGRPVVLFLILEGGRVAVAGMHD